MGIREKDWYRCGKYTFLSGLKDLVLVVRVGKRALLVSAALHSAGAFACVTGRPACGAG
jgi:hypothetical protein